MEMHLQKIPKVVMRWLACAVTALFLLSAADTRADLESDYSMDIQGILKKSCYECHGPDKSKGGLNFVDYPNYQSVLDDVEMWKYVLERVQASEMPPSGSPEMDYNHRQTLMNWLRKLPVPQLDCDQLASDRTQNYYRGYVMSRRLTRYEFENSVNDLLGIRIRIADRLPADGAGGEGFDTNGSTLFSSPLLVEKYLSIADEAVDALMQTSLASREFQDIAPVIEGGSDRDRAFRVIQHYTYHAFRRPVDPDESAKFLRLFDTAIENGGSFNDGVGYAIKGILISPDFLFLVEPESDEPGTHPLGPYQLATRLSYFIWSSLPDQRLLDLAESREITRTEVIENEVDRMLADPRSSGLASRFALQWLDLDDLGKSVQPDSRKFPEFDSRLLESMKGELLHFFTDIFRYDRSLLAVIDSNYSFVDDRLADLYGIPYPGKRSGTGEFQRVSLAPETNRGGLLGMSAIHLATSYPTRTSPVLRGRWILESLIGDKVPPPPPNVPELEEEGEARHAKSLREQLELHRTNPDCAACHDRMDPLGFGLENFDVLGRWRTEDRGTAIDATGVLPSGEKFNGPSELRKIIQGKKDKVIEHMVSKMIGFAYGRELNKFDKCVIDEANKALKAHDYRPSVLVKTIATSFPFRNRFYAIQE